MSAWLLGSSQKTHIRIPSLSRMCDVINWLAPTPACFRARVSPSHYPRRSAPRRILSNNDPFRCVLQKTRAQLWADVGRRQPTTEPASFTGVYLAAIHRYNNISCLWMTCVGVLLIHILSAYPHNLDPCAWRIHA